MVSFPRVDSPRAGSFPLSTGGPRQRVRGPALTGDLAACWRVAGRERGGLRDSQHGPDDPGGQSICTDGGEVRRAGPAGESAAMIGPRQAFSSQFPSPDALATLEGLGGSWPPAIPANEPNHITRSFPPPTLAGPRRTKVVWNLR